MVSWLFILCTLAVGILGWWLLPRWQYWKTFEVPDRALAYFALFIGLAVLLQQITDYHYGLVYMLSDDCARQAIASPIRQSAVGERGMVVVAIAYWFLIAGALFAIVALTRGTIRDAKSKSTNEGTNLTSNDIQNIILSNQNLITQI